MRFKPTPLALSIALLLAGPAVAENLTLLHVGDQESWLISAQGNVRSTTNPDRYEYYGGIDRLAGIIELERLSNAGTVLAVNAGDAFLPSVWFKASTSNPALATAYMGGQDFYDTRALRQIGFNAITFGNHEFDLGPDMAAAFARASATPYLSSNLDFSANASFQALSNVKPSEMVTTAGGHKVAIIGATTPLLNKISSPGNVSLKNFDPMASDDANLFAMGALVQEQVNLARANGATAVVLVSHLQSFQNEAKLIPTLSGIDVVVSGGGHETMANPGDSLVRNFGAEKIGINGYPQVLIDKDGNKVLAVTSSFGNRYVGVLDLQLDDVTGQVVRDAGGVPVIGGNTRMQVVSPAVISGIADPNIKAQVEAKVSAVFNESVLPVQTYLDGLKNVVIGQTEVFLNGERGAKGAPGSFVWGLRNAETNLGNLAADSLRFFGKTDIALQNGGGVRASLQAGNITAADPLAVLAFTNLVVIVNDISPERLKSLLEHGYGAASPDGNTNGRFPQISGMKVVYDSSRAVGERVRSIVLDDGTVLVMNGAPVPGAPSVSMSTIDFLANGGDGYNFSGLEVVTPTNSLLYSEALQLYLETPVLEGGLGGVVTAAKYGAENPFDFQGRQIDMAIAVPEPETWAMLLAGLGLIGLQLRRKPRIHRNLEI